MGKPIYLEYEFWALLICTIIVPSAVFIWMMMKRKFSQISIVAIGVLLVVIAGMDAIFLRILSAKAKISPGILDDQIFVSEISIALYIIPLILAGVGVNLASHVLCNHLEITELDSK